MKIKKNDKVIVIAGKDKGTESVVTKAFPVLDKVIVEGVNMAKKHMKATRGKKGEIISIAMPIHVSNVALVEKKVAKTKK